MSNTYYTTEDDEDAKKYKDAYVDYIKQFTTYYRSQYDNVNPSDAEIDTMANKVHDNIIKYRRVPKSVIRYYYNTVPNSVTYRTFICYV